MKTGLSVLLCVALGALAFAQAGPPGAGVPTPPPQAAPPQAPPTFRSSTSLALLRFHVVRKNRYVDSLTAADVALYEDGVARPFDLFEGGGSERRTIPIEMAILVDTSGSVVDRGLLDPMTYRTTLLDALPGVSLSVYGFARDARRYCAPTRDAEVLGAAFEALRSGPGQAGARPVRIPTALPAGRKATDGASWIYESALAVARDAVTSSPESALRLVLLFSDGQPTTTTMPGDVAKELNDFGVPVFPVVLGRREILEEMRAVHEGGYNRQGALAPGAQNRLYRLEARDRSMRELASLATLTGGRSFDPPVLTLDVVRTILATMASTVVAEYVVGFSPAATSSTPKAHKLEVKLRSKDLGSISGGKRTIVY